MGAPAATRWLFSPAVDLAAFGGSAVASFAALAVGWHYGLLDGTKADTPEWAWVAAVLLIDVAHVWSTLFRVYLDPAEFRRRRGVYLLVPVVGLVAGIALYDAGPHVFWRCLAYLAVFHFVRQQYGWVMLYRARCGERDRGGDGGGLGQFGFEKHLDRVQHLAGRFALPRDGCQEGAPRGGGVLLAFGQFGFGVREELVHSIQAAVVLELFPSPFVAGGGRRKK